MPAELNALYDDYIGEKEWQDDREITPLAKRNQKPWFKS